jgi:fatty acid desaturase
MSRRRALEARTSESTKIARDYPQAGRAGIGVRAFLHWAAFYSLFALYVTGRAPAWVFASIGLFVFIRYFDLTHEEIHTRQNDHWLWHALRRVFSVAGPLQLGYEGFNRIHWQHHARDGGEGDPDLWLERGGLLSSFLVCLTHPEQAVIRYVRQFGFDRRLVLDLGLHLSAWLALLAVCTPTQFVVYTCVLRLGNCLSFWVFSHILHRADLYVSTDPIPVPRWLRWAWLVLVGRNSLNAITYHFLHHAYPTVPALQLPALSARLARERGAGERAA